jgi:hypothetical protein
MYLKIFSAFRHTLVKSSTQEVRVTSSIVHSFPLGLLLFIRFNSVLPVIWKTVKLQNETMSKLHKALKNLHRRSSSVHMAYACAPYSMAEMRGMSMIMLDMLA